MRPVLAAAPPGALGIAVSGGSDSMALLALACLWSQASGRSVRAVTVDHGLRPESAAEIAAVSAQCARLGIEHSVLRWTRPSRGNLQDEAREGRRRLIAGWTGARGIRGVLLGHTLDDQAETVLMRLGRGSGVDGLSAMAPVAEAGDLVWLRPLLTLRREALRAWLRGAGIGWSEDASNADPAFTRVRARAALEALASLGVNAERLAATAGRMRRAREALEADTRKLAADAVVEGEAGDVTLVVAPLAEAPEEIGLRLVAAALMWVSGARYRPRAAQLEPVFQAIRTGRLGRGATLHGCVIRPAGAAVSVRREPARAAEPVPAAIGRWDGRWCLHPPAGEALEGLTIGALGSGGLAACGERRRRGPAREILETTPALWRDGTLVAAPLATGQGPWHFQRIGPVPPPWHPRR